MEENASERITQADAFLRQTSWDGTWLRISRLMDAVIGRDDAPPHEGVIAV